MLKPVFGRGGPREKRLFWINLFDPDLHGAWQVPAQAAKTDTLKRRRVNIILEVSDFWCLYEVWVPNSTLDTHSKPLNLLDLRS